MKYPAPKVGDTVFVRDGNDEPFERKVSRVGRKFFYVACKLLGGEYEVQIELEDWESPFQTNEFWHCHPSLAALQESERVEKEEYDRGNLWRELGFCSNMAGLSLNQLQRIKAIINEGKPATHPEVQP